ncbi:MAG TPA: hypothetical protein VND93_00170 [Myxococcales bacterium]|nr:hypothetical protein [Myxococcales bacterium]
MARLLRSGFALAVLLALAAAPASAEEVNTESSDCNGHGVALYPPPGSVIPTNGRFILEGVGVEVRRVQALEGDTLTLRAGDDAVPFVVLFAWRSGMNRVAMLVKPRSLLKANRTYTMNLRQKMPGFHFLDGHDVDPTYVTGKGPDDQKPEWLSSPAVGEGVYRKWDDTHLTRFLRFNLKLREDSPAYLVLQLQRARGSIVKQTYFLPVLDDQVLVGHDACSGRFTFEDGRAYRGEFQVFDIAGNEGPKLKPMEFNAPKEVGVP